MYLRTPKRYQVGHRRRHLFSIRWLWLWILTPIIVIAGWLIYQQRDQLGPPIRQFVADTVDNARGGIATMTAPTALPTTDPADHIIRGDNAWSQGAIEQAVAEYKAAADGAPNNVQIHYRYTYGLLIDGDNAAALSAAEDTITANPFVADGWAIRALALARNQRYPEAVASALQALAIDPKDVDALAFMAEAYLNAGQPATAEEKINQALQIDPNSFEANYMQGVWTVQANFDYTGALDAFQTAHDLAPNMPQALINMAWANWNLDNSAVGLDELEQVVENNPNNLDALYALGYIHYQVNNDTQQAEDYLNRCIQVDSKNASCLSYLATIKTISGDQQGAADLYQRIIDAGTTSPLDYLHAGRAYANLSDCNKATPLLRQGYTLEQQQDQPDGDRLAAFQEFMSECGAPYVPAAQSTTTAPLLIPLDNGTSP